MEDTKRSLSIKLYDVMDKVGVSEKIRKLCQDMAIREEIIDTITAEITRDVQYTIYIFGSFSEGTTIEGLNSDIDIVYLLNNIPVIDDIRTVQTRHLYMLMFRDKHTYPGYVKLQYVQNKIPATIYETETGINVNNFKDKEVLFDVDADTEGRICLKHFEMCRTIHDHERHGPADTSPGRNKCSIDQDNVFALRCRTIPIYAQTWLHRRRQYNWPSRDILQKMCDLGCFVVGVGHSSSREEHIEWRISFSLQERLLMFSLNPTQHKCYVLLKIIKNDIIKAEIGESISSYHCKTCLFYAIEVTQQAIWRPDNLVCCVQLCLMILLTWVVNGVCPNYFVPSANLFEKPQFRANRYRLLEILKDIIAEKMSILLRMQCGDIKNRILQPGIVQNNMSDIIVYDKYVRFYLDMKQFSRKLHIWAKNFSVNCQNSIMVLAQNIELFKNTRVIDEHSEQQTSDAISYMIPVLHQHIALRLASLVCKVQGQEHAPQLLYLSIHHFELGSHADLMTSRLLVVSLLFRLEKYGLCEIILEGIEHDVKGYVVTQCSCLCNSHIVNGDLLQKLSTNNVSCQTAIRTVYVGCVNFARCDAEITPLPLQYEMYRSNGTPPGSRKNDDDEWFDLAVVDGKIYLYFLQYLVYSQLNRPANKQVAFDNLVWVLGDDPNLGHRETAFNLLGWIHVQESRIPEAVRCFVRSWRIRPVHNAANWHLGIALYTYYTRESATWSSSDSQQV